MHTAYLSLGSNLGDRLENLRQGVRDVAREDAHRVSSIFLTEPVGPLEQPAFYNLVLEITTNASPRELLERARAAEQSAGRVREVAHGPRTLDVDVLLVGELRSDNPEVLVPHPRMSERRFVLVPLRELAPELVSEREIAAASGAIERLGTLNSLS